MRKSCTFKGHEFFVESVTFSPDGRQVLTGSSDDTAIVWDAASGQQLRMLKGHKGRVMAVAFSPDGKQVLTGSGDDTAILWDAASGQQLRTLTGHAKGVSSVAFSPDGRQVVTGSSDKTAILWDATSGQQARTFQGPDDVSSVAFSPDGKHVLIGSGHAAFIWDAASGQQTRKFQGNTSSIKSVAFSRDGKQVLAASWRTVAVWGTAGNQQFRTLEKGSGWSATFSPDGTQLLTSSDDKTAILWDAASGQAIRTFKGHTGDVKPVAFSPDGKQVLTGSYDQSAILWDAASGQQLRTLKGHGSEVSSVVFSPDGKQVLTGSYDHSAILWDAANGRQLQTFEGPATVSSVAISPDGKQVLTGSSDNTAILWDAASGQQLRTFQGHVWWVQSVAFSPDGRHVLTGASDRGAILWDAASGQQLHTLLHFGWVNCVAYSPDGRQLLTASADGIASLWDAATGQELALLICLDNGKDWLVVTPEGLFDGSEGGRQKVAFRIGDGLNVVSVDRFFQDFYRPGLLQEVMQGERTLPEVRLGRKLPPTLKILSPRPGEFESQEVSVEVEATDQGSGVSKLAIFQNGARVLADGETRVDGNITRRTFRVMLVEGENHFRVQAASGDGAWESEPVEVLLRYQKPLAKSHLYLLCVGVNRYANAGLNLRFAASDATAMAALFSERGKALYQEVHVKTLLDKEATKAGIKAALTEIAAQTRSQDTFIVYLAGHGTTLGQRYYFLPHELRRQAESLEEDVRSQGLPGDLLADWIGAAKAIRRIQIYDTCASGAALGLQGGRSGVALRGAVERLARAQGIFTIAAATATEEAMEREELGHGLLCYALLAGLKGVDRGPLREQWVRPSRPDQVVDVMEWFTFASNQVPRLMEKYYGMTQELPVNMQGKNFPVLPLSE